MAEDKNYEQRNTINKKECSTVGQVIKFLEENHIDLIAVLPIVINGCTEKYTILYH